MSFLSNLRYPGLESEPAEDSNSSSKENKDGSVTAFPAGSPSSVVTALTPDHPAASLDRQPVVPKRASSDLSPVPPLGMATGGQVVSPSSCRRNTCIAISKDPSVVDYGYGSGSPDTAKVKAGSVSSSNNSNAAVGTTDAYGYGSGSPDVQKSKSKAALQLQQEALALRGSGGGNRTSSSSLSQSMHVPKSHHTYDRNRVPRRSSLKSLNNLDAVGENGLPARRGVSRHHSIGCTRVASTTIEVRVRGQKKPVQRQRSIDFSKTVQVKEVAPVTILTNDVRELWLQADDFAAMKEHRRSLLKQYKEDQAAQKKEPSQQQRQQQQSNTGRISLVKSCLKMAIPVPGQSLSPSPQSKTESTTAGCEVAKLEFKVAEEDNFSDSFRGLEKYIDKSARRNKNNGWDAVLLEQDEQGTLRKYERYAFVW